MYLFQNCSIGTLYLEQLWKEAINGNLIPILHEKIIAEYEEVLRRKKFPFSEENRIFKPCSEDLKKAEYFGC